MARQLRVGRPTFRVFAIDGAVVSFVSFVSFKFATNGEGRCGTLRDSAALRAIDGTTFRSFRSFRLSLPSVSKLGHGSAMAREFMGGRNVKRFAPVPEQLRSVAQSAARTLRSVQPSSNTVEIRVDATSAVVPASALQAMVAALEILELGLGVGILALEEELSTEEAARQMGVSRPYLVGLLEKGEIPFRKVGSRRRIRAGSLAAYLQNREERKREAGHRLDQHLDQIRSLLKRL